MTRGRVFRETRRLFVGFLVVVVAGCASSGGPAAPQTVIQTPPLFPPQSVMQSGDYAGFMAENENALKSCQEPEQCAAALFNIGFLHAYPKSPYYNPARALKYLDDLKKGAPDSPWNYQARVWSELLNGIIKKDARKRQVRGEIKARETVAEEPKSKDSPPEEAPKPAESPPDSTWEADRKRMQDEIRSKEDTIRELNRRIERSRQIDIEIEKKERGLLY